MTVTPVSPLHRGIHYRRLSVKEGGVMAFELYAESALFEFSEPLWGDEDRRIEFQCLGSDGTKRTWLTLYKWGAAVSPFYRWNGNSVKVVKCGKRLGTPDFENGSWWGSTLEKSLFHDCLFQFSALPELFAHFDLAAANWAYHTIEGVKPFKLASIYDGVLRNWSQGSWNNPDPNISALVIG